MEAIESADEWQLDELVECLCYLAALQDKTRVAELLVRLENSKGKGPVRRAVEYYLLLKPEDYYPRILNTQVPPDSP